jgi:TonB dependent receptor
MSRLPLKFGAMWLFAGLLLFLWGAPVLAQRLRGEVRLEVRDPGGAGVAAHGEILSEGNAFQRTLQIAADGHLLLQDLPFGVYRLSLVADGFAPWSRVLEVHSEVPTKLSVTLGLATVTTQVQVNDEITLVDPTRTGTLYAAGQKDIREEISPQPGRDILDVVASQPGWLFEANGVLHPRGSEYDVQFVVDGQPQTQNRSPAFAPGMDSEEVESLRVLTAGYPAEFGRKLGGIVEITTDKNVTRGWHGDFDAAGGSFDQISGSAGLSYARANDRFCVRAAGLHSSWYLDPPVLDNFNNLGNSGGLSAVYDHDFSGNDRLRLSFSQNSLRYLVPNDLTQQSLLQRQDAASVENAGQVDFQHSISPALFLNISGSLRDSSFALHSNALSTPVIVNQDRGYREGYIRGDLAGHHGHHDWNAGADSFFTPVHEALQYHITDPSKFDPGTQLQFAFTGHKWDIEPSFYVQDQMRYGEWNFSAGLRFDHYSFVARQSAFSPRIGASRYVSSLALLLHASYDRVFQMPAMENLLLASSPQLDAVSPVVLRLPVAPARANYYEGGVTKALFGKLRLDANVFRRDFHNYPDDDVLLQTGVSFPISYAKARIFGEEVRLEVPHWGRFSGFVSYANQSAIGQGPITGGLFIGSDANNVLMDTSKFGVSQDQRNTLRARVRLQAARRVWFAMASQYGSGLPADVGENPDIPEFIAQYGEGVVSRVNFTRGRVEPNFSLDLGAGVELFHKEQRSVQVQFQAANVTDRMNVINFASLFSGTAVGLPRSFSARLRFTF